MTEPATPPAAQTLMCACAHHWGVHRESGRTAPGAACWGYIGNATPGPLREPCNCAGFEPWTGPTDSRTGEPIRPLTMATDGRVTPPAVPAEAIADSTVWAAVMARRACPVKLTMPVVESGLYEIRAGGLEVGSAERLWSGTAGRSVPAYHAELWLHADAPLRVADRVSRPTLRELKAELQRRLDSGDQWSQQDERRVS